ncbi:MAG: phosphopantetheine-binding protein, partial [Gammaproteobacteria bacterium]|nr:phosphopantetheine-binding protein [Gammaproteobacteria bacterium]
GKLDRASLPKPDREARLNDNVYIAPVTELEKKISAIWSTVLGVDSVGLQDNFFDLGGNSLLVVSVHAQLQQLKPTLSVIDLFKYPTIQLLVKYFSNKNIETALNNTPTVPVNRQQDYFKKLKQKKRFLLDTIEAE